MAPILVLAATGERVVGSTVSIGINNQPSLEKWAEMYIIRWKECGSSCFNNDEDN